MPKESPTFFKSKDKATATHEAAAALSAELTRLAQEKTPVLLLVSGGSALAILDSIDPAGLGPLVTLGVLDERYSTDPQVNNFQQLMQTSLYTNAKGSGSNFIDTRVQEAETQASLSARFEDALRAWKKAHPTGQLIITQGIGPDGHTSGVLPFPENPARFSELFIDPSIWVAAYDASGKNPYPLRVTTTLSFLQQVNNSFVFACGEDKKAALAALLADDGSLAQTPARIIHQMPQVAVFTDIG
jgi:6-phosphogluconolactonase/glucosamine-6-phosphate isomerase/deaminase